MITRLLLHNRLNGDITAAERAALEASVAEVIEIPARQVAVRQGVPVDVSTLLLEGMMTRHMEDPSGRRHLVGVHVPGDFVDLHAYALRKLDHNIGTLTPVKVAMFPHGSLARLQAGLPELARKLWFLTLIDAAMHRQWAFRLSSLTAIGRIAHFLCEMNARMVAIGQSDGRKFTLPMTQADLGEACSLTSIHVNRVIRELREEGLCTLRSSLVEIQDLSALVALGQFQPDYLYFNDDVAQVALGRVRNRYD